MIYKMDVNLVRLSNSEYFTFQCPG